MHPLVLLAKSAIENYIRSGEVISPPADLPKEFLERRAGSFISILKDGHLRGCIGTYLPTKENVAKEIISNAIAATKDYRFGCVKEEELSHLSYTVYILDEPELTKGIGELNPKKFGIIVKTISNLPTDGINVAFDGRMPFKTGLLLPGIKGVVTIEQQISIACQKAGIDQKKEKFFIYKFTVEKYGEE